MKANRVCQPLRYSLLINFSHTHIFYQKILPSFHWIFFRFQMATNLTLNILKKKENFNYARIVFLTRASFVKKLEKYCIKYQIGVIDNIIFTVKVRQCESYSYL